MIPWYRCMIVYWVPVIHLFFQFLILITVLIHPLSLSIRSSVTSLSFSVLSKRSTAECYVWLCVLFVHTHVVSGSCNPLHGEFALPLTRRVVCQRPWMTRRWEISPSSKCLRMGLSINQIHACSSSIWDLRVALVSCPVVVLRNL